ncbi:hypothetical protein GCM10009530_62030 [Microbispora corallina]|uniref:Integral membrane protein n=1 Tax=Microbispora corallina TaxID=83302 RepID=A0ABQ4G7V6_9ACTN|nr:glycosyltransferase family 39 protein [Microbispora corallina]GIH43156.1 hypothetical protein Mco01_61560 [Microbispora corallina]
MTTQAPARWGARSWARLSGRLPWLAVVAAGYAAAQLTLAAPHLGLGWDETVYLSQVDPRNPAAYFSAPRSRGVSLLAAPVLAVIGSTAALRVVLALLSAAALYGAYRIWRPLLGPGPTALAALLFAGLWTTVLYGPQAMPNLWVALSAVAAAGWFLRAQQSDASRAMLAGLGVAVAAATLFRFSDGIWLASALLAACLAVRAWRRPAPAFAVAGGLAAGGAEWIAEAYARWGGLAARLHASSATEGGMGRHWAGGDAWRSLNGPLLCRPCTVPLSHPALTLWWLSLPLLAFAACAVAVRAGRPAPTLLPVACAGAMSVPYLVLIDYSAPRFFLPVYALLALPVATLAARIVRAVHPAPARTTVAGALAVVLVLHLATQYGILRNNAAAARVTAGRYQAVADALRRLGLHPPCLVTGSHAQPIGYYAGCASADVSGNNRDTTRADLLRRAATEPTAALAKTRSGPPDYARTWTSRRIRGTGYTAYLRSFAPR